MNNASDPLNMPVLITGGAGFLGRALVDRILQETTWAVRVLALPHEPVPTHWDQRVQVFRGDITRRTDVEQAARGCALIFHLAALVGDAGSDADHQRVTVGGTARVLDIARTQKARVVLTTSICAYGDAIQHGTCTEATPLGTPQGPYGRAKQGQEALARTHQAQGGQVCVVRPANIVGLGSGPWLLDACAALRQGLPVLINGGHGCASLAVVDNVADFLLLVAQTPSAFGQAFNIHDDLPITWRQYFSDLALLLGTSPPASVPRWLAYTGAHISEPLFRRFARRQRPPVTLESLNLIAWHSGFTIDKALALGWRPRVSYADMLSTLHTHFKYKAPSP